MRVYWKAPPAHGSRGCPTVDAFAAYCQDKDQLKQLVPIPPTQETVNTLFGENIQSVMRAPYLPAANRKRTASA